MTPDPNDLLNRSIGGYLLQDFIGPGAFAWVFTARGPDAGQYAVKVLPPRYVGEPQFETRFRHEAHTAADLAHPNVVRIRGIGDEGGLSYFAMDFYPTSLASQLERDGTLAETALLRVASQIGSALAFTHQNHIVHCDVKPLNILFTADGTAVLADFGIARTLPDHPQDPADGMTIGTPHYLSPEQAQGLPVDGRSDLYSLGITLYKASTGSVPFHSTDWFELAQMHVEKKPDRPRAKRPALSNEFDQLILRLLAKDPADRFESAASMLATLGEIEQSVAGAGTAPISGAGAPTGGATIDNQNAL